MNSECARIADQLHRAFDGEPWHGSPLREILNGVTSSQALHRSIPYAHNIWELVLHIEVYARAAYEATQGVAIPQIVNTPLDWKHVSTGTDAEWSATVDGLFRTASQLEKGIQSFSDSRLEDTVPGRKYHFYYLFHGIVQHSLYHGGQIALLKKAG